jgi:hypothetical protein
MFPVWNNRASATPQWCEVDSCNEHVGGGGGQVRVLRLHR